VAVEAESVGFRGIAKGPGAGFQFDAFRGGSHSCGVPLRRHRRTVDRVDHHPNWRSREICHHVLRQPLPREAKEPLGDVAHMRCDNDILERPERVVRWKRLTVENVEAGTRNASGPERP
jgi:hypothetical protein